MICWCGNQCTLNSNSRWLVTFFLSIVHSVRTSFTFTSNISTAQHTHTHTSSCQYYKQSYLRCLQSFLKPAEGNGEGSSSDKEGDDQGTTGSGGAESDTLQGGQGSSLIGSHGATSILPEVQIVTGEEGEKNVLQVSH